MTKKWTLRSIHPPASFGNGMPRTLPMVQQTSSRMTQSAKEAPACRLYANTCPNGIGARPVHSFTQVVRQPANTNSMEPFRLHFNKKKGSVTPLEVLWTLYDPHF